MRRVLRFTLAAGKWLLLVCGVLFLLEVVAITAFVARDMRRDAAIPPFPAVSED